jgi:hypothetical protein
MKSSMETNGLLRSGHIIDLINRKLIYNIWLLLTLFFHIRLTSGNIVETKQNVQRLCCTDILFKLNDTRCCQTEMTSYIYSEIHKNNLKYEELNLRLEKLQRKFDSLMTQIFQASNILSK